MDERSRNPSVYPSNTALYSCPAPSAVEERSVRLSRDGPLLVPVEGRSAQTRPSARDGRLPCVRVGPQRHAQGRVRRAGARPPASRRPPLGQLEQALSEPAATRYQEPQDAINSHIDRRETFGTPTSLPRARLTHRCAPLSGRTTRRAKPERPAASCPGYRRRRPRHTAHGSRC